MGCWTPLASAGDYPRQYLIRVISAKCQKLGTADAEAGEQGAFLAADAPTKFGPVASRITFGFVCHAAILDECRLLEPPFLAAATRRPRHVAVTNRRNAQETRLITLLQPCA